MSEFANEFTGERVIPGQVNADLWAEHMARYVLASRLTADKRVLDIGCGAGYGTSLLAQNARTAMGVDFAPDAIQYASAHSSRFNTRYVQASAAAMPFAAGAFDLVVAFEVIEHLSDWPALLQEARRVLAPGGVFLVSTPNRLYYSESRARSGPNPYHLHEFDFEEFQEGLGTEFPHVEILLQNRLEALAFYSPSFTGAAEATLAGTRGGPSDAHFFLAICATGPGAPAAPFVFIPEGTNLLREREQHIALLEAELAQSKVWLEDVAGRHQTLQLRHAELTLHLEQQNTWAQELDAKWKQTLERVASLQDELERVARGYAAKVAELEKENRDKTQWAVETERRLTVELNGRVAELAEAIRLLDQAEATVVERTLWAQRLDGEKNDLASKIEMVRQSRWVKLGRALGLGPKVSSG